MKLIVFTVSEYENAVSSPDLSKALTTTCSNNDSIYTYTFTSSKNDIFGSDDSKYLIGVIDDTETHLSYRWSKIITKNDATWNYNLDYLGATYNFTESVQVLPAGTDGTAGTDATYVLFGDWPQTLKKEDVTISEGPITMPCGNFTYYKGSDGYWYVYCLENAYGEDYKYADGTEIAQSSAELCNYFKVEPIKWRVVDTAYDYDGNSNGDGTDTTTAKLLVAESILTANVPYYESTSNRTISETVTVYPNNYMYSQIRAYLNGLDYYNDSNTTVSDYNNKGFLQTAFSETAQGKINETTVDNSEASTIDAEGNLNKATLYYCADTQDKIFLLSEQEATTTAYGFAAYTISGEDSARIRKTTDYARANYAFQSSTDDYSGSWSLRSPYYKDSEYASYVNIVGSANINNNVSTTFLGVVPALSISF